jgi:hypothetical protein
MSKRGIITAPAALFLELEDELDDPLDEPEPVPVGVVVTVPVPALPAWLRRLEQELAVEAVCVFALPPKSQAVEALFWDL